MIYSELTQVPYVKERAIIINVGTRIVSTLSLLSVLKYANMPILLIDCPIDKSMEDFFYFQKLKEKYSYDLISLPLQEHGMTLDYIFNNLNTDYILLVDSDLEILNDEILLLMKKWIQIEAAFGAGFTHGPCPVNANDWISGVAGRYEERMWIPFSLLNVAKVREALNLGHSFRGKTIYNILPQYPRLSKFLFKRCRNSFIIKACKNKILLDIHLYLLLMIQVLIFINI